MVILLTASNYGKNSVFGPVHLMVTLTASYYDKTLYLGLYTW